MILLHLVHMISLRFLTASLCASSMFLSACSTVPMTDDQAAAPPPDEAAMTATSEASSMAPVTTTCPVVNTDPADAMVTYTNSDKGISFAIPYNAHWGYADAPLSAFSNHDASDTSPLGYVLFGPPTSATTEGLGNSCDLVQSYDLAFFPSRSAADAVKTIEGRGTDVVPNTSVRTINGLTVVQYKDVGLCNYPTMEVIGKKYNYSFTTSCGGDPTEEWKYLETIVNSIKL